MINPELMKLLDNKDAVEILKDATNYQLEKFQNVSSTSEGRDWYHELPNIIKEKFDNYKTDYETLSRILNSSEQEISLELKKGYYYWRLIRSACLTYSDDLAEYDQQLNQEFNLKETEAISNNQTLNKCIEVLNHHVTEN